MDLLRVQFKSQIDMYQESKGLLSTQDRNELIKSQFKGVQKKESHKHKKEDNLKKKGTHIRSKSLKR